MIADTVSKSTRNTDKSGNTIRKLSFNAFKKKEFIISPQYLVF